MVPDKVVPAPQVTLAASPASVGAATHWPAPLSTVPAPQPTVASEPVGTQTPPEKVVPGPHAAEASKPRVTV